MLMFRNVIPIHAVFFQNDSKSRVIIYKKITLEVLFLTLQVILGLFEVLLG